MIKEPIYVYEYLLCSGTALNAASQRRVFPGALIRVGAGYGCIHPWPEFGDLAIAEQLERLAQGVTTPQSAIALECAELDGAAREAGVSLFDGLSIPRSHYSWSFAQPTGPQMQRLLAESWPGLKAKGFANYGETRGFLEQCARASEGHDLKLRVDFNGCLDVHAANQFLEHMPLRLYNKLDLVEDPCPYSESVWTQLQERWRVRLALDKGWQAATSGFSAVVVKPARRDWRVVHARHPGVPLVLTSAMDHPLGQMYAAYQAALARQQLGDRVDLCGLCTQHLFTPDAFTERVHSPGGKLEADSSGGGLGFGDLLERLPWRLLS
jgi:o-succinylbenzoate synthase